MKIMNNISNGSIHIERNFLEDKLFNKMSKEISKLKYKAGYQPHDRYFGNRFQAYPRKMIAEELLKSKTNTPYGIVHQDNVNQFAAILFFHQSTSGGTAFFEYEDDKYPDIQIGAYPNRLIIYSAKRNHAPCNDFTFEETYKLNIFFDK